MEKSPFAKETNEKSAETKDTDDDLPPPAKVTKTKSTNASYSENNVEAELKCSETVPVKVPPPTKKEEKCKGCGKTFQRLNIHLKSRKGQVCSKSYSMDYVDQSDAVMKDTEDEGEVGSELGFGFKTPDTQSPISSDVVCKGCQKTFKKIFGHLNCNSGKSCRELYTNEELQPPNKQAKYDEKNKEAKRNYYENNKENNKDTKRKKCAEYKKEHREEVNEKQSKYNKEHREEVNEKQRKYDKEHREEINEKRKNIYHKKRKNLTLDQSLKLFRSEIVWGPIYPCISCHRCLFRNSVTKFNSQKYAEHSIVEKAIQEETLQAKSKFFVQGQHWICSTCQSYIKKEKLPKLCSQNSLQVYDRPEFLNLTEVENVLIAPRINFIKMIKLPVSRMAGIKDKIINVPIPLDVIKQTIQSLPRTLEEASVIPVLLKRQKKLKNNHFQQHIRPAVILKAVEYLRYRYPHYEGLEFDYEKIQKLTVQFIDDDEENQECESILDIDDVVENEDPENGKDDFDPEDDEKEERNYVENDPVKKHQTEVSSSTFLIPENMESSVTSKSKKHTNEGLVLAPGENQIPKNILREKNPFVLHFPILFPDGKGGLHDPDREQKITPQQFINQRLYNINPMFAQNKPFVFSAVHYVEKHQLESQMKVAYMRGKMKQGREGQKFLQTEDGFNVFDNIVGSFR